MKINRYPKEKKVKKLIGKGSYCKVYQLDNNKIYKIYDDIYHNDNSKYYDKFLINEITNINLLSTDNKNIIYEEIDIFTDKIGIVMNNLGINLYEFINSRKKIDIKLIKKIISDVCKIMIKSNNKFIIHGDLKPENIMIDRDYNVNIIDWNLSLNIIDDYSMEKYNELQTIWYRSPEQIIKLDKNNYKIDVWSLGVIFIELLSCKCGLFSTDCENKLLDMFLKVFGKKSFPDRYLQNINLNYYSDNNNFIKEINSFIKSNYIINDDDYLFINFINGLFEIDSQKRFSFEEVYNHPFLNNNKIERYDIYKKLDFYPRILNFDYNMTAKLNAWYLKKRKIYIKDIRIFMANNKYFYNHLSMSIKLMDLIMSYTEINESDIYHIISISIYITTLITNTYYNLLVINSKVNKNIFKYEEKLKKKFNEICYLFNFSFNIFTGISYNKILNKNQIDIYNILYIKCQEIEEINYINDDIKVKLCINYINTYFKKSNFVNLDYNEKYYYDKLIKSISFSDISKIL